MHMRIASTLVLTFICSSLTGCIHRFRIAPPTAAPVASTSSRPVHTSLWGLKEPIVKPANCTGNGLAEVITSRRFGQRFVSVVSLGFHDQVTIEWRCAKDSYSQAPPF